MKIEQLDVEAAIDAVKTQLAHARDLSPALRAALEVLLVLVTLLLNRLTLNKHEQQPTALCRPQPDKDQQKGHQLAQTWWAERTDWDHPAADRGAG